MKHFRLADPAEWSRRREDLSQQVCEFAPLCVLAVAADFGGRYVFLQDQESTLVPDTFDPDYWTLTAGLAIGF